MQKGDVVIMGSATNCGMSMVEMEARLLVQEMVTEQEEELKDLFNGATGEERKALKRAHFLQLYGGSSNDLVRNSKESTNGSAHTD